LKGSLLDTEASLLNLTKHFNSLNANIILDCKLLNSFPDHIFFHPYNCPSLNDCIAHLKSLDYLCHNVVSSSFTLIVVTNTSVILLRNMQTLSAAHFWKLGYQISFSKTLAGRITVSDAKLYAIRLKVYKTTSMDIKCIILITDFLSSAKKVVDLSVHSVQAHSLFVLYLYCSFVVALVIKSNFRIA